MTHRSHQESGKDDLPASQARAIADAALYAREAGIDPDRCLVTVEQQERPSGPVWRVNYCPRDYVGRRGGDLLIEVDAQLGNVLRVLRGQ